MTISPLAALQTRLADLPPKDQIRLRKRIDGARKIRDSAAQRKIVEAIGTDIDAVLGRRAARLASVPDLRYPDELPVSQRRKDIAQAIAANQVVIVAGETGSGKTTQLPKICLELGRGIDGLIGHTQPRRIAARTVAERVAEELNTPVGGVVGFQVRFTGQVGPQTMVKLMTDGILLAEIQRDKLLRQYDTLIIDEAHERSLNIDFILGYLKQLLPKRPDLKLIITSATIDPQRFSAYFDGAPIVEVSGRTYPVEVRYRPLLPETGDEADTDEEPRDQIEAICAAAEELAAEGPGDILVFLSGEREIRDTAEALAKRNLHLVEVLPLYARLSVAEQHKVFAPHTGRRIVLATNVAETSLTVPGIKYVIDPGTARISRYSHRLKVQRLPIESISQASANQRKGRCGRLSDGICIRLYSEADFESRPQFTDPEILRTNLASVILQMTALGLGDIAAFPFLEPPDRRQIKDGIDLLHELGALDPAQPQRLTAIGRKLADIPVDPRLARMILAAQDNGCVREVLIIVAGLTIQDPRERPTDRQEAAQQKHARFADPESDFSALLNLWTFLREQQKSLSSNQFRRLCRTDFLNYLRVREWQDLVGQLRQITKSLGVVSASDPADPAAPERIHQSLLAGLLSHIGLRDPESARGEYIGARNAKFAIFPGSVLFKRGPRWLMSAELVETSRLWARMNGKIEPEWIEPLAAHLVRRSYSEPHWEKKQAAVIAYEKVTLYGVPIVVQRKVNYGRLDPALSRELFIRHALVEGDWETSHEFFTANRDLLDEVEELEHRARRRDILVDDETLVRFYEERIPAEVVSGRHFDSWWRKARREQPDLLTYSKALLVNEAAARVRAANYPDTWPIGGGESLRLTYQFEPGTAADGVTVHVPLPLLSKLSPEPFTWQVPGLREELITALLRGLPKSWRRNFVPVPDHAKAVLAALTPAVEPLVTAVARQLLRDTGVAVPPEAWNLAALPDHLRVTFRVTGEDGEVLADGKDLAALKTALIPKVRQALAIASSDIERHGLTGWSIGTLPARVQRHRGAFTVTAFPALVDQGDSVAVQSLESQLEQQRAMWAGTRRLLLLSVPSPATYVSARLTNQQKLALSRNPHASARDLMDDCAGCAVDALVAAAGGPAWDEAAFERLRDHVRGHLIDTTFDVIRLVEPILASAHAIRGRIGSTSNPFVAASLIDIRGQLDRLVYRGFVTATGLDRLPDVVRYLKAIERRLDKLPENPPRDRELTRQVAAVQQEYDQLRAQYAPGQAPPELDEIRWMLEELRVSYFAQALGTAYPVSDVRIYRAMDQLAG
jgi:ATP-dependent helicase HrpA